MLSHCINTDCPKLYLEHGTITIDGGNIIGGNATYTCNAGYQIVGDITRTCQESGRWSGDEPICGGYWIFSSLRFEIGFSEFQFELKYVVIPPQTLFVVRYTVFTLSVFPSVRVSVRDTLVFS